MNKATFNTFSGDERKKNKKSCYLVRWQCLNYVTLLYDIFFYLSVYICA